MLSYDDPKWKEMRGGYGIPYDPTPALKRLENEGNVSEVWEELWENLHHQYSVGEASYAAVLHLVRIQKQDQSLDWHLYGLVAMIEIGRWAKGGPRVPDWLGESYRAALKDLVEMGANELVQSDDPMTVRAILAFLAFAKGKRRFGELILRYDESELGDALGRYVG